MERLDKILSKHFQISRNDIKKLAKKKEITVNGQKTVNLDIKVDPQSDVIFFDGERVIYKDHIYIMLNKPKGVVSATEDSLLPTVVDLVPEDLFRSGLFPAGRLDKDTEGFVLITDDGDFAHRILSPKNHVEKTYIAVLERGVTEEEISLFASGVVLSDGTKCLEAKVSNVAPRTARVIIHEGRYHQVKRMFASMGNHVLELKRIKIGHLSLDDSLMPGECRLITEEELMEVTK